MGRFRHRGCALTEPSARLRDAILTRLRADTGTGGLFNASSPLISGVDFEDRAKTTHRPRVLVSISERPSVSGSVRTADMQILCAIEAEKTEIADDWGVSSLLAIGERLRDRLVAWTPTGTGWTFSPIVEGDSQRGARGVREHSSNVLSFRCVAAEGSTGVATAGVVTIVGTLSEGGGGVSAVFPAEARVTQQHAKFDRTRLTDEYARVGAALKSMAVEIGFDAKAGMAPSLPTGGYSLLAVSLSTGVSYSGPARVFKMTAQGSARNGGRVGGSYIIEFDGVPTVVYGEEV